MSKFDDPDNPGKVAEAPSSTIELLHEPTPMAPPPDPYNRGQGRSLGENEQKPEATKETKVAMAENKDVSVKPIVATTDQPRQPTWVERMEGTKRAYNENNNQAKGKDLHNIQPAATSVTTEKTEPPKAEPKASDFVKRLQSTPPPPPTNIPTGPKR